MTDVTEEKKIYPNTALTKRSEFTAWQGGVYGQALRYDMEAQFMSTDDMPDEEYEPEEHKKWLENDTKLCGMMIATIKDHSLLHTAIQAHRSQANRGYGHVAIMKMLNSLCLPKDSIAQKLRSNGLKRNLESLTDDLLENFMTECCTRTTRL